MFDCSRFQPPLSPLVVLMWIHGLSHKFHTFIGNAVLCNWKYFGKVCWRCLKLLGATLITSMLSYLLMPSVSQSYSVTPKNGHPPYHENWAASLPVVSAKINQKGGWTRKYGLRNATILFGKFLVRCKPGQHSVQNQSFFPCAKLCSYRDIYLINIRHPRCTDHQTPDNSDKRFKTDSYLDPSDFDRSPFSTVAHND